MDDGKRRTKTCNQESGVRKAAPPNGLHAWLHHSGPTRPRMPPRGCAASGGAPFYSYWIRLAMLNIGKYREIRMPPTTTPITTMSIGSMSDVSAFTVSSTSVS